METSFAVELTSSAGLVVLTDNNRFKNVWKKLHPVTNRKKDAVFIETGARWGRFGIMIKRLIVK